VVVLSYAGSDAQPIKAQAKEKGRMNLSAVIS